MTIASIISIAPLALYFLTPYLDSAAEPEMSICFGNACPEDGMNTYGGDPFLKTLLDAADILIPVSLVCMVFVVRFIFKQNKKVNYQLLSTFFFISLLPAAAFTLFMGIVGYGVVGSTGFEDNSKEPFIAGTFFLATLISQTIISLLFVKFLYLPICNFFSQYLKKDSVRYSASLIAYFIYCGTVSISWIFIAMGLTGN